MAPLTLALHLGDGTSTRPTRPCPLALAQRHVHGLPDPAPQRWHNYMAWLTQPWPLALAQLHGLPDPAPWQWHGYMPA
jgi:hypothetical protein